MVKVDDKAFIQHIYFPKSVNVEYDTYVLTLTSEVTQNTFTFSGLTDESKSKNYFKFLVDFSQLDDGEYSYSISDVATGLLTIGEIADDIPSQAVYTPFVGDCSDNEIVQYYPNGNLKYRFQNNKIVEIIENGTYNVGPDSGYTALLNAELHVDVNPPLQSKSIEFVENTSTSITCDDEFYGLDKVDIDVNVPVQDYWNSGFTSGYTDGYASGSTDGYASGSTDGYASGVTDGIAEQKAKLSSISIGTNGTFTREDGYSAVTVDIELINNQTKELNVYHNGLDIVVADSGYTGLDKVTVRTNVPVDDYWNSGYTSGSTDGYASGVTDGIAEQKAKLISTAFTVNGTYTREDGFSSVTVNYDTASTIHNQTKNVSATTNGTTVISYDFGYTGLEKVNLNVNVPVQDYYDSGYTKGYEDGFIAGSGSQINYYTFSITPEASDGGSLVDKATVTFSYAGSAETVTFNGAAIVKKIIPGVDYTVTFGNVSGYTTPSSFTGTSTWGGSMVYNPTYIAIVTPYNEQYLTFYYLESGQAVINFKKAVDYSTDNGSTWTSVTDLDVIRMNVSEGDKILFKGDNVKYDSMCEFTGPTFNVYGNIMSMINSTGFTTATTIGNGAFEKMFYHCASLISAENLVLPATNIGDYCYNNMFNDCYNLTKVPALLPATTLKPFCYYNMFRGCSRITNTPELPATALTRSCYDSMFYGCTRITNAPELPAPTLAQSCYDSMFNGCTSLNYVKCLATDISAEDCTSNWLSFVSATGTFLKNANMTSWTTGVNGIPSNWTVQDAS